MRKSKDKPLKAQPGLIGQNEPTRRQLPVCGARLEALQV